MMISSRMKWPTHWTIKQHPSTFFAKMHLKAQPKLAALFYFRRDDTGQIIFPILPGHNDPSCPQYSQ
jgi:hypothetical protein